jgi:hypothetical protein
VWHGDTVLVLGVVVGGGGGSARPAVALLLLLFAVSRRCVCVHISAWSVA